MDNRYSKKRSKVKSYIPIPVVNRGIGKFDKDGFLKPKCLRDPSHNTYGSCNHNKGLVIELPNGKRLKIHNEFAANWVIARNR